MAVYIVTGKLGNGKTLVTVGRIRDALREGRRVATNLDINLKNMFHADAKNIDFLRIPDKPTLPDLQAIGKGYSGKYNEKMFGCLVLDECGTWFNSRNWQDKDRKAVNDWFLHARKLLWDVYIIIQDISILDSQARDAIGELLVECRRLDNLRIPFISAPLKILTGINLKLPRIHRAKVTYGDGLISDVWVYRGNDLFHCYQTDQMFLQNYPHGTYSMLTPWHIHGRYKKPLTPERIMRITKIYWKRFKSPIALSSGLLAGVALMFAVNTNSLQHELVNTEMMTQQRAKLKTDIEKHNKPVQDKKSQSSASAAPVDQKPAPMTARERLAALFENMRITGTIRENGVYNYFFQSGDIKLSTRDLISMGFAVSPIAECAANISQDDVKLIVRCI